LEGAKLVQSAILNAQDKEHGLIPFIISLITLTISYTFVFIDLQESLNMIWKLKPKPGRIFLKNRFEIESNHLP
jgi:membrane protein